MTTIGWLHEIKEPDRDWYPIFSFSENNPWSHWVDQWKDQCEYRRTPLISADSHAAELSNLRAHPTTVTNETALKVIDELERRRKLFMEDDPCGFDRGIAEGYRAAIDLIKKEFKIKL